MTTVEKTPVRGVREAHLRWVPLTQMKVSPRAQREFNPAWAQALSRNFNLDDAATPVVNYRDGHYYLIDGQHTVAAYRLIGYGDQQIQCWVYEGLTEEEEAEKFLRLNNKRAIPMLQKFRIAVVAEREDERDIDRIVRANGMRIGASDDSIGAVGTLTRIYRRSGGQVLGRTVRIIRDSYGDAGFEAPIIDGVALVCHRYNGSLDDAQAVLRLASIRGGHNGLMTRAEVLRRQTGGQRGPCVAAAVVEVINRGRGGKKLPDWFRSDAS